MATSETTAREWSLRPLAQEAAARLREFLSESRFGPSGVLERLKADRIPTKQGELLPLLLYRTQDPDALNLLIRVFILNVPIEKVNASAAIPADVLENLLACGLLTGNGAQLESPVRLSPFENLWIVTDTYNRLSRGTGADDVLTINPTTLFILNLAIRTPAKTLLDFGAGCGVVGLEAAANWAEQVTGTDITARACSFARFNASLNGNDALEILQGDSFAPVAGRKFDRILANPPFYVTPSSHRVFAENPMDLDGFCREIVRRSAEHLQEGGFSQLLCEWAEIEGEPWQERIAEWVSGTGCDAYCVAGGRYEPAAYTNTRLPVVIPPTDPETNQANFQHWIDYYARHKVKAIHAGFLTLRRRSGENWLQIERADSEPSVQCGDAILAYFQTRDRNLDDEALLDMHVRLSEGVQLEQRLEFSAGDWKQAPARILQTKGLRLQDNLAADVAGFVMHLDGEQRLGDLVAALVEQAAPTPQEAVRKECLSMVRRLISRGFLQLPPP